MENMMARILRLLVVEDDPQLQRVLTRTARRRSHHVDAADHAGDALMLIRANAYDAVLLDIRLRALSDGRDLLSALREEHVATYVLTGQTDEFTLALCSEYGARRIWEKPTSLLEVFTTIEGDVHDAWRTEADARPA